MRLALALVVLALAGCGTERTVTQAEADELRARRSQRSHHDAGFQGGSRNTGTGEPEVYVHPEFAATVDEVHDAVVRACMGYYRQVDVNDRQRHRVEVQVRNAWSGKSDVVVQVLEAGPGRARAEVSSTNREGTNRAFRDVSELVKRIHQEMDPAMRPAAAHGPSAEERLRELDALHAKGLITDAERAEKRAAILAEL